MTRLSALDAADAWSLPRPCSKSISSSPHTAGTTNRSPLRGSACAAYDRIPAACPYPLEPRARNGIVCLRADIRNERNRLDSRISKSSRPPVGSLTDLLDEGDCFQFTPRRQTRAPSQLTGKVSHLRPAEPANHPAISMCSAVRIAFKTNNIRGSLYENNRRFRVHQSSLLQPHRAEGIHSPLIPSSKPLSRKQLRSRKNRALRSPLWHRVCTSPFQKE